MSDLLPARFLFRVSLPVSAAPGIPRTGSRLLDLPAGCKLPEFAELDQAPVFAELRLGWNDAGLGISVGVRGKKRAPQANPASLLTSDGLQVWIDTRNTQNIHRASRFCHHFVALPTGGRGGQAFLQQLPIARAREESPLADPRHLKAASTIRSDGYDLELWLPAAALTGFAPESNPRLGFYYLVRDGELGDQVLSVGEEFPYAWDPSLWWTLELK